MDNQKEILAMSREDRQPLLEQSAENVKDFYTERNQSTLGNVFGPCFAFVVVIGPMLFGIWCVLEIVGALMK